MLRADTARAEAGISQSERHPSLRLGWHSRLPQAAVGRCLGRGGQETPITSLGKLFFLATRKFTYSCQKKKKSFLALNLLPAPQRGGQKESRKRACFLLTIIVKPCQCLPCKTMFSCSIESLKQAIANRNGSSVLVQCERLCLLAAASTAASSGLGGCSALPYALVPFSLSFCNYPLTFPV